MDDDAPLAAPVDGTGAMPALDLPVGARGACPADPAPVPTPGGALRVVPGPGAVLRVELEGAPVAQLTGTLDPAAEATLLLDGEQALLDWEAPRAGAWGRPPRLVVRWRRHRWTLVAHGSQRELHGPGRTDGPPRARLVLEPAGDTLSWSAQASPRELALLVLLVRAATPVAFAPELPGG